MICILGGFSLYVLMLVEFGLYTCWLWIGEICFIFWCGVKLRGSWYWVDVLKILFNVLRTSFCDDCSLKRLATGIGSKSNWVSDYYGCVAIHEYDSLGIIIYLENFQLRWWIISALVFFNMDILSVIMLHCCSNVPHFSFCVTHYER